MGKNVISVIFLLFLSVLSYARTAFDVAPLFKDNMVLQQKSKVPLWGRAHPGDSICVLTSWDGREYCCRADSDSLWCVDLQTGLPGGPYEIRISGRETMEISNVMIGDVWLCSGQSNMEWSPYSNSKNGIPDIAKELEAANRYPSLRFCHIKRNVAEVPVDTCTAKWMVSDSVSARWFSAVGNFFGRSLCDKLGIPIGLIGSYWGGTGAEVWTPAESVEADSLMLAASTLQIQDPRWFWPIKPGATYNAMIHPLRRFPIAGAIWYQGESNCKSWWTYSTLLRTMVEDWRSAWGSCFPFYIVQISPFYDKEGKEGANVRLRDRQRLAAESIPESGIVTISDVGDLEDIHPRNKRPVGERLANLAMYDYYGKETYRDSLCPLYDRYEMTDEGLCLYFKFAGKGLRPVSGKSSVQFELAGKDGIYYPAEAEIAGNRAVLTCPYVEDPASVRYAWGSKCIPDLVNSAGLPVSAFLADIQQDTVRVSFSDRPVSGFFTGNGVQWSAWPHADAPDAEWGDLITDEKWEMVYERLDFMKPRIVRVMDLAYWRYYKGLDDCGNPILDFDNAETESLCRLLDWCQSENVPVILGEWGTPDTFYGGKGIVSADDQRWIGMICEFMDFLIVRKGYDCIKYYNLVNEPNGNWSSVDGDWAQWRRGYSLLYDAMKSKGLDKYVALAGPDVVASYNHGGSPVTGHDWVRFTADSLDTVTGIYDIHSYPDQYSVRSGDFFDEYKSVMALTSAAPKPFIIGELGMKYKDGLGQEQVRRAEKDPFAGRNDSQMFVYEHFYGVDVCDAAVQAMCAGYSGSIVWDLCDAMHTVDDSGDRTSLKRWGMWNTLGTEFGTPEDENLRPWFHAWSLMCRFFCPDMKIYSPSPEVSAEGVRTVAGIGKTGRSVAVVNNSDTPKRVSLYIPFLKKRKMDFYLYSEHGMAVDDDGFIRPAHSGAETDSEGFIVVDVPACSLAMLTDIN